MHDPRCVAFEIKYPWWKSRPWPKAKRSIEGRYDDAWNRLTDAEKVGRSRDWKDGYRDTFLTIWHVDPEADGSDDSCGMTYPRLTADQRTAIKGIAWSEAHHPWYQRLAAKSNDDPVQVECLMRGAVRLVASALGVRLSWDEVCDLACRLTSNPLDNFRSGLCHLPGYHTNFDEDTPQRREDTAYGLFSGIARQMLRDRRPWYRDPRWHVHHWKIQVHPWQALKRRYWDRCCRCGKRGFPKGVSAMGNWSGTETWHSTCDDRPGMAADLVAQVTPDTPEDHPSCSC